ncbi:MAG: DUF116 domain-containing protein [Bacillota bacterium]
MSNTWRLLDTGIRTAAENMALDDVILTARSKGLVPDTVRFLQFNPRCALVGYHQDVEQEIRVDWCRGSGVDINRRITGGGALFWDETQIGWEVIASRAHPSIPASLPGLYAKLCSAVVSALRALGIEACFRPRNDIEVRGRKISGTGGTELGGAFLFQGTLLVDFDADSMLRALRIPTEKLKDKEIESVKDRVTCIRWELGRTPPAHEIKALLAAAFEETLGVRLIPGGLAPGEEALLAHRLPFFLSDDWVRKLRQKPRSRVELRSIRKARGGLIRVSLVLDGYASRIKSAFITGDFFAHPQRVIYDLEAELKDARAEPSAIRRVVEGFFSRRNAEIPGVSPRDIADAITDALDKARLPGLGIPAAEVNSVFTVNGSFEQVLGALEGSSRARPIAFLLPYCAKRVGCAYRYREGCAACGRCSAGAAYATAREMGFDPVTIQNYEMLEQTLEVLKAQGATAFLGSCCEAFLAKHRDDFDRIGLPGILIDVENSTCYDLGKEREAHRGLFDNETQLKVALIRRVLEVVRGFASEACS